MTKLSYERIKGLTCLLLIITSAIIVLSFLPEVRAETKIGSISPSNGYVNSSVQLTGNISTSGGRYTVKFDEENLTSGFAVGILVAASFYVPNTVSGDHSVTLIDVSASESNSATFKVLTAYTVEVPTLSEPTQRQEGDATNITVKITGGTGSKQYFANVTVKTPANVSYQKIVNFTTSSSGNNSALIYYPTDFSTGANTNFTGEYTVSFNNTLASQTFSIGLTNATKYHRKQIVDIKAVYRADENVTLKILGTGVSYTVNLTANSVGLVHYTDWSVPLNASVGSYKVSMISRSGLTSKSPADVQNFTVPGFGINVTVKNLAGEPVGSVTFRVFENGKSLVNRTSTSEGVVYPLLILEIGNYTCEAYYKSTIVGKGWLNITAAETRDFYCNLTNLKITVVDEAQNGILDVKLRMTSSVDNRTLTTDINGTAVAHSLLPSYIYTLNVSRYGTSFNTTSTPTLPIATWYNMTIICPKLRLQINVTDSNDNPINNANVKLQEMAGGSQYIGNTANGIVYFNCTFGNYTVQTYIDGIELNDTFIELFQNRNVSINCVLYGLTFTVKVVDYFGQPVSNVNVTLQREGLQQRSFKTNADGTVVFDDIIGGSVQVAIYLGDETQPFTADFYTISSSTTVQVSLEEYVSIAGFLVLVSQLVTVMIIVIVLVVFLGIEVYRRRRFKPQKTPVEQE